ncbi:hypothetical protein FB45DRAFT_939998 [Roridomyces roridus]|uniref:F-box domain-containing protein n=1 Tax=Roridomyces roridus TaxID=1738132 RepID=A0AAD7FCH4_9AGAR|nr:hypothetical protein FB45DRAFT_939998 [Roridomyces roridus]
MVLTRRAHKARMVIARWLPNELLARIIDYAPRPDQAALCRVSKLFHALTLPVLYREIEIDTTEQPAIVIESFCSAMMKPGRAEVARQFILTFGTDEEFFSNPVLRLYGGLTGSIRLMHKLEHLHLIDLSTSPPNAFSYLFREITFPRLSIFRLGLQTGNKEYSAALVQFFARHPNITEVCLWMPELPWSTTAVGSCLPNLQQYEGSAEFLPHISSRGVKCARVPGWIHSLDDGGTVAALKSVTVYRSRRSVRSSHRLLRNSARNDTG